LIYVWMLYDKPSLSKLGIYYKWNENTLKSLRNRAEVTSILLKKCSDDNI